METIKKNQHGGYRPNSGRPRGTANLKTRECADILAARGENLLEIAVNYVKQWAEIGEHDKAFAGTIHLLPYLHPRLAAMAIKGEIELNWSNVLEQSFGTQFLENNKCDDLV